MKTILELVQELKGTDVTELALVSGRFPCVRIHGAFKPVDDVAASTAVISRLLNALGGGEHVPNLSPKPTQWKNKVEGLGEVTVLAIRKADDTLQVRVLPPAGGGIAMPGTGTRPKSIRPARKSITPKPGDSGKRKSSMKIAAQRPIAPPMPDLRAPRAPAGLDLDARSEDPDSDSMPAVLRGLPFKGVVAAAAGLAGIEGLDAPGSNRADFELDAGASVPIDLDESEARGLDALLARARKRGASDLHVVAGRPALFRIAGELVAHGNPFSPEEAEEMLMPFIPERLRPILVSDGSVDFALTHETGGRFRANVSRQRTGFKGSFRVIPNEIPTLRSLALPEDIGKATHHHQGLIVITGPTGHGKTSTLAALVNLINSDTTHHIITVEDPVEYIHPRKKAMISQREVGTHTKSFANALKGSLRQDPDVIVVGELRDTETVRMALSASETGHLVIGTMNTPSAAKTIDRLIDLFPPADQAQVRMTLAGGLRLIVAQRLLPNKTKTGMVAAAEILPGSIALWNLIRENKTYQIPSLQQRGKSAGIHRLDDSLLELVQSDQTTLELALPFAENPDELAAKARGQAAAKAAAIAQPPGQPPPGGQPPQKPGDQKDGGLFARAGALFGKKGT